MTELAYPSKEQCPCCGRIDRILIARLTDDTLNTHTEGMISGTGIGFGAGGLGVGVGFARVNLDSVSRTRLQANNERVQLAKPNNTENVIKGVLFGMVVIGAIFIVVNMLGLIQPSPETVATAANPATKVQGKMGSILPIVMFLPIWAMVFYIGLKIFSAPKAMMDDEKQERVNRELSGKLEQYYRTLRYCDNCHVIFDQAGYACFVERGAVETMSRNAGIFEGNPIETNRIVNETITA